MDGILRIVRSLRHGVPLACFWVLVSLALPAQALTFDLFDHGFGTEGPHYGLRLDGENLFFSVQDSMDLSRVTMEWVPGESTAVLSGTLREVDPSTNLSGPDSEVLYTLTGVASVFSGATLIGFEATGGQGTVGSIPLLGKAEEGSDIVFRFLADGHRIPGDDSTIVGSGWLVGNGGFNDWLVRTPDTIPEPATALLLGLGLVAMGSFRKQRRAAG